MTRRTSGARRGWAVLVGLLAIGLAGIPVQAGECMGPQRDQLEGPLADAPTEPPAPAVQLPPLMTLREGAKAGVLVAEGFKPSSYRQVQLRVRNTSKEAVRVDLCGSHLVPRRKGSCQRLGIGPVVTPRGKRKKTRPQSKHPRPPEQPPGTVIIGLEAGEERVVHLWTCCLDSGKAAPSGGHVFTVATDPLPEVREQALRWWADNPDAPQGVVNRAIWQFRPIDEASAFDFMRGGRRPRVLGGNDLAVHAGTVYRLRAGELLARDPDGIERFLGTQMDGVYPTDSAIYAVSWGSHRGGVSSAPLPRELWRLVPTGQDPWAMVARIGTLRIDRVQVSPRGAILVLTDKGLYRVDRQRKVLRPVLETKAIDHLSVAFRKDGSARVTHQRPAGGGYMQGGERKGETMPVCELYEVDPATGAKKRVEEFWNVRQVRIGPAGLYALTHGGKLRRMAGRSFRNAPGQKEYDRIVHVGRKYVWLESKRGRLVAADKAGRIRFEAGPTMPDAGDWGVDAHDDRIVLRKGRRWSRVEPANGKKSPLERNEAASR